MKNRAIRRTNSVSKIKISIKEWKREDVDVLICLSSLLIPFVLNNLSKTLRCTVNNSAARLSGHEISSLRAELRINYKEKTLLESLVLSRYTHTSRKK